VTHVAADRTQEHPMSLSAISPARTITDVTQLGTVLGIWAHPDDEAFLSAGLMAAARDAGQRVVCVTATLGEHGTDDPGSWPPNRMARVRERELHASLAALGVSEHHLLGLTDGTCAAAPHHVIVEHLAHIVDLVAPDTIVTFGPDGMTGHEDHQTVSAWATDAHTLAAPDARLLYATTTEEFAQAWEPSRDAFNVFLADGLPLRTPACDLAVELRLDADAVDRKIVALRAQASQTTGLFTALGEDRVREWWSTETFVEAHTARARAQAWGTWRVAA
jgi:LmbE family N-acetylglucosaminyl deacetylase